jgi:hypothetical protein
MTRDEIAARAQRMLWGAVGTLQEVEDTLDCLVDLMPDSDEDMLEDRKPEDVMLAVEAAIECALSDALRPMIVQLKQAAVVTADDLKRRWRDTKERIN